MEEMITKSFGFENGDRGNNANATENPVTLVCAVISDRSGTEGETSTLYT